MGEARTLIPLGRFHRRIELNQCGIDISQSADPVQCSAKGEWPFEFTIMVPLVFVM
jgi:hypothetical protein